MNNRKQELAHAILKLRNLLKDKIKVESIYQKFFEENEVVFDVLGYEKAYPFRKGSKYELIRDEFTNLQPEPDFIVKNRRKLFEIFEIKTPVSKNLILSSNPYRERFTAEIISYIEQTNIYEEYFTNNPQNRRWVSENLGLTIQEKLDIKIVIGLNKYVDRNELHKKTRSYINKIDIITYDDILRFLEEDFSKNYGDYKGAPGISFHFYVRFKSLEKGKKQYFLDLGKSKLKNRVSVYLNDKNEICFQIWNRYGKEHLIKFNLNHTVNTWIYLTLQIGKTKDGLKLAGSINEKERASRLEEGEIDLDFTLEQVFLGCDMSLKNFGKFDLCEKVILSNAFNYEFQNNMVYHITREHGGKPVRYIDFNGKKYMYKKDNGFIQKEGKYAPMLKSSDSEK